MLNKTVSGQWYLNGANFFPGFTNNDDTVIVYYSTIGDYDVSVDSSVLSNFVTINYDRVLPNVISTSKYCFGKDGILTISPSITDLQQYNWVIYNKTDPSQTFLTSSNVTLYWQPPSTGKYIVSLTVIDCCGLSIPILQEVVF